MAYKYEHFIPQNIAPSGAKYIGVYDGDKRVLTIPLGGLTPPTGTKLYSFGLVSDIHLYPIAAVEWTPEVKFDNALTYFESKGCMFCVQCGDFTQTGLFLEGDRVNMDTRQFAKYKEICDKHTIHIYGLCGNHESYMNPIANNPEELRYYTGTDLYYSVEQGSDLFILLGQPNPGYVMSDEAYNWLVSTLADNTNKRCFVFIHSYIEEDSGDAVDYRENSVFDVWGTTKTEAFMNVMRQHPNVILFHGHSHMKFECQEYDDNANYTERNGFRSVHVPSLSRPRYLKLTNGTPNGETPEDNAASQGYIVDVYDDCIVLNGMDLINQERIPIGTYQINL